MHAGLNEKIGARVRSHLVRAHLAPTRLTCTHLHTPSNTHTHTLGKGAPRRPAPPPRPGTARHHGPRPRRQPPNGAAVGRGASAACGPAGAGVGRGRAGGARCDLGIQRSRAARGAAPRSGRHAGGRAAGAARLRPAREPAGRRRRRCDPAVFPVTTPNALPRQQEWWRSTPRDINVGPNKPVFLVIAFRSSAKQIPFDWKGQLRLLRRTPTRRSPVKVITKADASPVTEADRRAEAAMRELLQETYPQHGILGEESGLHLPDGSRGNGFLWVLDPIDGTRGFITGARSHL